MPRERLKTCAAAGGQGGQRTVVELVSKNVHVKIFSTFSPKRLGKIFETLRFQW